jgi:hypothetical protein
MAAAMGNADAVNRLQSFAGAMGMDPAVLHNMPNLNDLMAAQRGDRSALARVRMQRQSRQRQAGETRSGQTGLQQVSFVSFHPPLSKRAKRLQRMGARLAAPSRHGGLGTKIVIAVLYLILGPLLLTAGVMMLFVVAMMIGLNLLFLALWLAVIHWAFAQDWPAIFNGFMKFVQDVSAAFNQRR